MRPLDEMLDAFGLPPAERGSGPFARSEGLVDGFALTLGGHPLRGLDDDLLIAVALPSPTDLGLCLAQGGLGHALHPRAHTGDAAFDGVIDVSATEPEAACALLTDAVRGAVLEMVGVGMPWIADHVVGFTCSSEGLRRDEACRRVRRVLDVAAEMERAAASLPLVEALRRSGVADAFRHAAYARGMSLRDNALCVTGETPQQAVWLRLRTVHGVAFNRASIDARRERAGLRLRVVFREPLGVGLSMRPAQGMDRVWEALGRGDLRLDDPPFDRAWTVSASDAAGARAVLHTGARAALTRLAAWGLRFSLDDRGIEGEAPVPASGEAVSSLFWMLDGLRDQLRARAARGAYR